jgi:hypothetical protein
MCELALPWARFAEMKRRGRRFYEGDILDELTLRTFPTS